MTAIDLMRKRERLLARCDAQREDLVALAHDLEVPLRYADRVIAGVRYLRERPLLLGTAVAALAIVQRRGLWKWARRGYVAWGALRMMLGRANPKSSI